eukprot:TRINITY_DN66747_c1_g5_i1.p1 TRINITY_DN66747_c1_g5~~TRINITY_DN66747_c1_g5_i1.p1  ORF type:complete len:488 (-),score=64.96 TRINITY_DN66747_c1_g5_i1:123-1562(-)
MATSPVICLPPPPEYESETESDGDGGEMEFVKATRCWQKRTPCQQDSGAPAEWEAEKTELTEKIVQLKEKLGESQKLLAHKTSICGEEIAQLNTTLHQIQQEKQQHETELQQLRFQAEQANAQLTKWKECAVIEKDLRERSEKELHAANQRAQLAFRGDTPACSTKQFWSFENDSGGYTHITDDQINTLLTTTFTALGKNPKANPTVTYVVKGSKYTANLKNLVQQNCSTQMKRSLWPPTQNVMSQPVLSSRTRTDVPSFRSALSSAVIGAIANAKADVPSVQQCLRSYAASQGLPCGILDHFDSNIQSYGLHQSVVWLYTVEEWVYHRVNNALRAEEKFIISKLAPYIGALAFACNKLQSDFSMYGQEHPTTLYRRLPLQPPELKKYKVGETFVWNSFTSTSCFTPPTVFGSTLFEIDFNQTALGATLFVEPFTNQPGEFEVLIPVGAFFEVVGNNCTDTNNATIRLKMFAAPNLFPS